MSVVAPRPQEQLLIDAAEQLPATRLLCNSAGRGQFAAAWATLHPAATATCFFLDLHLRNAAAEAHAHSPNVQFVCQTDLPPDEADLVAWCVSQQGDAELTREMLETAHHRLTLVGQFVVATNNPRDTWLQDEMQKLFAKVTRQPHEMGVLYRATKSAPLKKRKDYSCEFAFRDKERLLFLRTRPGVFSHRSLDGGARALIEVMQNSANQRVLDLGCGSGAVGLAAGFRAEGVQIAAIDSNPRAVESAEWAAGKNRLHSFQATLDADGSTIAPATFDVVLANPPYYSHFRLAELFLTIAARALRPTGRLWVVTKQPDWYLQRLPQIGFEVPNLRPSRTYWVVDATRSEPA